MKQKPAIAFFALALLCCIKANGQRAYFREEPVDINISNPNLKHVTGIAADKNQCIWFGTQVGIFRYDGTHFRHYSVQNSVLQFERIQSAAFFNDNPNSNWAFCDAKGNHYSVDENSKLKLFDWSPRSAPKFHQFGFESIARATVDHQSDSLLLTFLEMHATNTNSQVFTINIDGSVELTSLKNILGGNRGKKIYSLKGEFTNKALVSNDLFYLSTNEGLLKWNEETFQFDKLNLSGDILGIPFSNQQLYLLPNAEGHLIIFCKGNIYEGIEDDRNNSIRTRLLVNNTNEPVPSCVFYSRKLQLFISYYIRRGLVFYRPDEFTLLAQPAAEELFPDEYYYSFVPEGNGFITTNNTGIVWLGRDGSNKTIKKGRFNKFFTLRDINGRTWFQDLISRCAMYMEPNSYDLHNIPAVFSSPGRLFSGIYAKNDSIYYFLSNSNLTKWNFHHPSDSPVEKFGKKGDDEFTVLFEKDVNTLWIGSDRNLYQYNMKDDQVDTVPIFRDVYIRSIKKLEAENILVGTYDRGIFQYKKGKWSMLASNETKLPSSAHALISDAENKNIWVSSNEGIIRMELSQFTKDPAKPVDKVLFRHFSNFGPVIPSEFNGSSNISGALLADSSIAFANAKGIVIFNPDKLVSYPLPEKVLIEASEKETDSFGSKPNHIQFTPVIPYLGDPQDLEIEYRLTDTDLDWIPYKWNTSINYNNVSPGKHDLQFRIRYHFETDGKEVQITAASYHIKRIWYQKTWFRILILIVVLGFIILLHNLRLWYLLRRKKELEKIVDQKTSELQETNENLVGVIDELSRSEESLKQSNFLKDEYYAVLTHDLRSPLKFLSLSISQLLDSARNREDEQLKKGLYAAYQCSSDVYKLIDEFVYWIRDNEHQLKISAENVRISDIVEETRKIYESGLNGQGNQFVSDVEPQLEFFTDPRLLFIILRNTIDNANKYTNNGTIRVSASFQNPTLVLEVRDTGRGMRKELIDDLSALQDIREQLGYKKRKSLGFYIMAMLTRKLGGRYTITSEKEKGTVIRFEIPEWR